MSGSSASKNFTQAQQNSLHGQILGSFAQGKGPSFVSLEAESHKLSSVSSLGDSQASGLAKFFASNLQARSATSSSPTNARPLVAQVSSVSTSAPAPKVNPSPSSVSTLVKEPSSPVLVRTNLNNHATVIKPTHVLSSAFVPQDLAYFAKDSLSEHSKVEQNNISLEALGPLVSLHARLLQEYYYLNFSRYDAVISDMHLNGQHLPLVLVNPRYGVLIVQLCSEDYEQLVKSPQLIHNHKKHSLHVRDQFVKHFAEPNNEFSLQDLKHVTYVLQCYEKLSAQEVVKLFPAQSILSAKSQINRSNIFTRWPVAGMVQRMHAHIERHFADPSAGIKGQPALKWLCHAAKVAFYLSTNQSQASLFENLEIPPLDRAYKEVMAIINKRAQLRGQYSKFARPEAHLVMRPRKLTVEFAGNNHPRSHKNIPINGEASAPNRKVAPDAVVTRRVVDGTVVAATVPRTGTLPQQPQRARAPNPALANPRTAQQAGAPAHAKPSPSTAPRSPNAMPAQTVGANRRAIPRMHTERALEQAHKAAQILKRAPQSISQSTRKIEQQIAAHAAASNPMMMVGTLEFD